ncbi:fibrous sheath CABYR-binding protein-like [Bombina bombina]|uniref:fibrous sheath CABYR-binding protein-like n=1 Tax=Bombina bombina TaxID=8345 RepID=UPI00235A89DD|nr:fibrous sheath CABYR-binding protein-like [Bombina bombina]
MEGGATNGRENMDAAGPLSSGLSQSVEVNLTSPEGSSTNADLPLQDADMDVKCAMEENVSPLESDESEPGEEAAQHPQAPPSPRYESGTDDSPPRGDMEDIPLPSSSEEAPAAEEIPAAAPPAPASPPAPAAHHAPAARRAPAATQEEIAELQILRDFLEEMRASQREQVESRIQLMEAINDIRQDQRELRQDQREILHTLKDILQVLREAHNAPSAAGPSASGPSDPGPSAAGPSAPGPPPSHPQSPPQPGDPSTPPSHLPQTSPMRTRRRGQLSPQYLSLVGRGDGRGSNFIFIFLVI